MPLQDWSESMLIAEMNDEPMFSDDFDALAARLEGFRVLPGPRGTTTPPSP